MPTGELFTNRPIYTARHHPYDPTVVDDDDLPILRDIPGMGRIAWAREPLSAGYLEGCYDSAPNADRNGGGTWAELQAARGMVLDIAVDQGGALDISVPVHGARSLLSLLVATIESGVCLLNLVIAIESNGSAGDVIVTVDGGAGFPWSALSNTEDYPVGRWRVPGVGSGDVYAVAASSPIELRLVDANEVDLGDNYTLQDTDRLHVCGTLLYSAAAP